MGQNRLYVPSTDFREVRDGRRSGLFWYDVDLSAARSISAGTAQAINIAGNSFYIDADPNGGYAKVHFQDTNLDRPNVGLYCASGTIFKIPFTQLLIENVAQVGKTLRIFYGVDVDFVAAGLSQIFATIAPLPIVPVQTAPAIGTASALLLAANASRKYLLFQNNGATDAWLNLAGNPAVVGQGIKIGAGGGTAEWTSAIPSVQINAISSTAIAANLFTIVEG